MLFAIAGPLIAMRSGIVSQPWRAVGWSILSAFAVGACVTVWSFVAPRPEGTNFRWSVIPWVVALSMWWGARAAFDIGSVDGSVVFALAGLTLLSSALRRPRTERGETVRDRDVLSRLALGAGMLMSCGPLTNLSEHFGGGWHPPPVVRAEHGAWRSLEIGPLSLATDLTVGIILPLGLWLLVRSRPRRRAAAMPLLAVASGAWGRAFSDLFTMMAAREVLEHAPNDSPGGVDGGLIDTLAIAADLTGGLTLMLCLALLVASGVAAYRRPRSSVGVGLAFSHPIASVVLASTSLLFAPPFFASWTMQAWQPELPATFSPLRRPDAVGDTIPRGTSALITDASVVIAGVDGSSQNGACYLVLPDRRTSMRDVVDFARRRPNRTPLALSWLRHDLTGSSAARRRWGFVDLSAGALSARTLILTTHASACDSESTVAGASFARCEIDPDYLGRPREALVLRDPGDLRVGAWLDAMEGLRAPLAVEVDIALAGSDVSGFLIPDLPRWGSTERPIFWALGLVLGALMLRSPSSWARRWFDLDGLANHRSDRGAYRTAPEPSVVAADTTTRLWTAMRSLVLTGVVVILPTVLWLVLVALCGA